jgi:hypothetical protein
MKKVMRVLTSFTKNFDVDPSEICVTKSFRIRRAGIGDGYGRIVTSKNTVFLLPRIYSKVAKRQTT